MKMSWKSEVLTMSLLPYLGVTIWIRNIKYVPFTCIFLDGLMF